MMSRAMTAAIATLLLAGCATRPLALRRPVLPSSDRICSVAIAPGTDIIVRLSDGRVARGALVRLTCDVLEITPSEAPWIISSYVSDDITLIGRVRGRSSTARGWIGAAIGAALVAPFGISMTGDMVLIGAAVGGIIGHNSGNSHVEVIFDRRNGLPRPPVPLTPLPAQ